MNAEVVGGVLVALVGALGAYLAAVRKLSGKIGTSEASQLWEESRRIRDDYRAQIDGLTKRLEELEKQNAHLRDENARLSRELEELKR